MSTQVIWRGDKAYAFCPECGKLVQLNKPIIGSMHFCTGETK